MAVDIVYKKKFDFKPKSVIRPIFGFQVCL